MNARIWMYFLGSFFMSMAAGFSATMAASDWVKLIICSLGPALISAGAYMDKTGPGGPTPPPAGPSGVSVKTAGVLLLALFLAGCSLRVYGPDGRPQLVNYGNAKGLKFSGPGTRLEVVELDLATPTKAAANGVTSGITAAGAAAAGIK